VVRLVAVDAAAKYSTVTVLGDMMVGKVGWIAFSVSILYSSLLMTQDPLIRISYFTGAPKL
jgi:hypothetical protein